MGRNLRELIKTGVVVVCHSADDVIHLGNMVDEIRPGYGSQICRYAKNCGTYGFKDCIAIRLEERPHFSFGYDKPSYYSRQNYTMVEFSEIHCDFGEFSSFHDGIYDLILGTKA